MQKMTESTGAESTVHRRHRMWLLITVLFGALALAACGGSSDAESATGDDTADETAETTEAETTEEPADSESDTSESDEVVADEDGDTTTTTTSTTTTTVVEDEAEEDTEDPADSEGTTADTDDTDATDDADNAGSDGDDSPLSGLGLGSLGSQAFEENDQFSDSEKACIEDRIDADADLSSDSDFDSLATPQKVTAVEILLDCAGETLEAEFLGTLDFDDDELFSGQGEELGRCIFDGISRDDDQQSDILLALISLSEDEEAPPETVEPTAAMLSGCLDFATLMVEQFESDPATAGLVDAECITSVADDELTQSLFEAVIAGDDESGLASSMQVVVGCMRFGELMAAQLAGMVELGDTEISCIDEVFQSDDVLAAMVDDGGLPDSALENMFTCFEPATLAALGGG